MRAAEERFKEIQTAYDVLGDAEKRAQYDRGPQQFFGGGANGPGGFQWSGNVGDLGDLGDLFGGLFNRGGGRQSRGRPGRDVEVDVNVSFEDSLRGATIRIPGRARGRRARPATARAPSRGRRRSSVPSATVAGS